MKENVLIVDDEQGVRGLIGDYLSREGYGCTQAASAEEAVGLLKQGEFDVVLTDIVLPGMDGLDLTRLIKRDHRADVIVITGFSKDFSHKQAVEVGASDFIIKPVRSQELLLRMQKVLGERKKVEEQVKTMDDLRQMAITDGLTGLFNKRHFLDQLDAEARRANRYNRTLSMLMIDVDRFKEQNDRFGHMIGDQILARLARVLKGCLRRMDSVYRYGGEEFASLLPETTFGKAALVAERIRSAVAAANLAADPTDKLNLTVSIGLAAYVPPEATSAFLGRADRALYLSKQKGRNCVTALPAGPGNGYAEGSGAGQSETAIG